MKTLRVYLQGDTEDTLRMASAGGLTILMHAHPDVRKEAERWLAEGLIEFVREADGGSVQRITKSGEPQFLDRIANSLKVQLGYEAELTEYLTVPEPRPTLIAVAIAACVFSSLTVDVTAARNVGGATQRANRASPSDSSIFRWTGA